MLSSYKRLITLINLLGLACLPFSGVQAQGSVNSPYVPSIIPPSPDAAALMKFTEVPVSTYSGTADISVPIYTIQATGVSIPISLNYHSGGIRVKEEASSVGLGWALNAGGMISRTIMGSDDFGTQGPIYFTNQVPQLPGDISSVQPPQANNAPLLSPYLFDFWCSYQVSTSAGTQDFTNAFNAGSNQYEMEPDIFSYSFPGHSGKFILTRAGQVVMQKQENIKIQFTGGGNGVTFTIIDEKGNTWHFNNLELTAMAPKPQQISSWLLSSVTTQQQDVITFNYVSGGSTASEQDDINETLMQFCPEVNGHTFNNTPSPVYYNQTLQSIDFKNGKVNFAFDGNRNDLIGGFKLDSISIYSKDATGALTFLKQDLLSYSYFNGNLVSPNDGLDAYRLRLDAVQEISGGTSVPPYTFVYNNPNPGEIANKHKYSVDHWGYFNNAGNSSTLIPSLSLGYSPIVNQIGFQQVLTYAGANRTSAFPAMQTFSLQQITYPTGGKTVLAYQANDYDYTNSVRNADHSLQTVEIVQAPNQTANVTAIGPATGQFDFRTIYPQVASPTTNATLSVAFRYNTTYSTYPYRTGTGHIWFSFAGNTYDVSSSQLTCSSSVCSINLPIHLDPQQYTWTAAIDNTVDVNVFEGIYATVAWSQTLVESDIFQGNSYLSPAGGLRIQSITNYSDASTIASQKVYTYGYTLVDGSQHSYGRLMSMPSYARYAITSTSQGGYCTALSIYGSSISSLTSAAQSNIVGYDQVTESRVDPVTGQDIGKTVYTYFNSSDTAISYNGYGIPGTLNIGNNLNGLLLSKVDYAAAPDGYVKVEETDNSYHTANRAIYYSPKYSYTQSTGNPSQCSLGTFVPRETNAWFYPSLKSEKILLDQTQTITYQQGDLTHGVTTNVANYYDNPAHYQLTRTRTANSKGDTLVTLVKYPQDYIPSGQTLTGNSMLDGLINKNMVTATIEKQDSLIYKGASSGSVTNAQLSLYRPLAVSGNPIVADRIYKLDIQAPVTNFQPFAVSGATSSQDSRYEQKISFDQYDGNTNITQFTASDLIPQAFFWDYVGKVPVAKVTGAALDQVAYTSFEADGTGSWTIPSGLRDAGVITGSRSYNLSNGAVSRAGLTAGNSYVVSYWTSAVSSYSVSGTTHITQGKTINGWTYFEHTVTGVTAVTITGASDIDELRLYPSTAQMMTYTYNPGVGVSSQCDVNNRVTYYFYDALQRLRYIKDQDGNIIKTIDYHYQGQ